MYIVSWIVLGAFAGWTAGRLMRGNQHGPLADIAMGIVGALGGGLLMRYGGLPGNVEVVSTTLSALLGALVLTVAAALFNPKRRRA